MGTPLADKNITVEVRGQFHFGMLASSQNERVSQVDGVDVSQPAAVRTVLYNQTSEMLWEVEVSGTFSFHQPM